MKKTMSLAALCSLLALSSSFTASAHEANTGWKYDAACCSNKDCTHVDKIEYHKDHVVFHTSMFSPITIKNHQWSSIKTKPSLDSQYHVCAYQYASTDREGNVSAGHWVRCVYIPGGG